MLYAQLLLIPRTNISRMMWLCLLSLRIGWDTNINSIFPLLSDQLQAFLHDVSFVEIIALNNLCVLSLGTLTFLGFVLGLARIAFLFPLPFSTNEYKLEVPLVIQSNDSPRDFLQKGHAYLMKNQTRLSSQSHFQGV